jgi:hypothetical protein
MSEEVFTRSAKRAKKPGAGIAPSPCFCLLDSAESADGTLDHVELHGLAFLQTLETTRRDCRVVHEDILTVLARDKAEALRVIEPLHSTLFHFFVFPGIELRWMESERPRQNLAWIGVSGKPKTQWARLLLTPGSTLTLATV